MVWYSHLFKNFPQFVVIHTNKGFGIVNKAVEVKNQFKGLDLIDRVAEELWMEVRDIVQEAVIKTIPKNKKCKKAKSLSEEALLRITTNKASRGDGIPVELFQILKCDAVKVLHSIWQ